MVVRWWVTAVFKARVASRCLTGCSTPRCFLKKCSSGTAQLCGQLGLLLTTASDYSKVRKVSESSSFTPSMIWTERVSSEALVILSSQKRAEGSTVSCSWDD